MLDPNAGGASDAIDDTGDGLAAFVQGSGASATARIRGFDVSPPTVTNASIPATATAGTPAAFSASASDFWGPVTIAWNFGDGGSATGASASHTFVAAGSPTVTVTATDSVGNTATKSGVVSVAAAPGGTKPPHAPVLSLVSVTNLIFRIGPQPTAINAAAGKRRVPVGTTFRFKLDESAKVSIVIDHPAGGRLSGRRCVKPTKKLAKHRRCTRYLLDGTLRRTGQAGANRVAFSGRIGHKRLGLGRHRATISATAAGLRGRSRTLSFTIVR